MKRALTLAIIGLVIAALASLILGARPTGPAAVWEALTTRTQSPEAVVIRSRIPRTLIGVLVGAALAMAGAAMQGLTRNPLADPGLLGLNTGAALAVVIGINVFAISTVLGYAAFALIGAGVATLLVYVIASIGRAGATPVRLALAGAGLSAGLGSIISAILMISESTVAHFRLWQVGVLGARSIPDTLTLAPLLVIGAVILVLSIPILNALALGDETATNLGFNIVSGRIVIGLGVVLLAATATALAGPIAFVGLVVPHAVRLMVGGSYGRIITFSAILGPILVLVADALGRVILPPVEVQVGVMTALVGAPVFIWLIRSRRQVSV